MDSEATNPLEMALGEMHARVAQIHARIADMNMLIDKEQIEVKRLQMKAVEATERMQRVEKLLGLGVVPTSDFPTAYNDTMELRIQLVKLQSHLERIQSERQQYEVFGNILAQWIATLQPPPDEV